MDKHIWSLLEPYSPTSTKRNDPTDGRFSDVIVQADHSVTTNSTIALLGVPQHIGVERNGGRAGSALAPNAIREQLYKLTQAQGIDAISPGATIVDYGNLCCTEKSLEEIHEAQQQVVSELLGVASLVIVLGGGHDIAYPDGMALNQFAHSMGIINIDAHPDVRELIPLDGSLARHSGSPFRQLLESPDIHIPRGCFVEFGIQPFCAAASHLRYVQDHGHEVLMIDDIRRRGIVASFEAAMRSASHAEKIFCSFDMDSVSAAYAPGVSAIAVDGFDAQSILHCATRIGAEPRCTLVDIVEVNPLFDIDNRTTKLAAHMLARIIWQRADLNS